MNGKERIAEQSRIWLGNSLLELLKNDDFSKITITSICNNADLARKTFYNYFHSKESLLTFVCARVVNQYFEKLQKIELNKRSIEKVLNIFLIFGGIIKIF